MDHSLPRPWTLALVAALLLSAESAAGQARPTALSGSTLVTATAGLTTATLAAGEPRIVMSATRDDNPTAVLTLPASIAVGQNLVVTGDSSFDAEGPIVSYEWTLGAFAPVVTSDPTFTFAPAVYPLPAGRHQVQLVVVDTSGNRSAADIRFVDVIGDVVAPTAILDAPQSIVEGQPLSLSGSRSFDSGGVIRRYLWTLDAHPVVETTEPAFVFTRPAYTLAPGPHLVGLQVMDDSGNLSVVDQRQVQVVAETVPTAVIGGPASIAVGADLTVSGEQSFDTVGQIVRYEWTLDARPVVATTASSFTFAAAAYPLAAGLHQVSLVVVDDAGQRSSPDLLQVRVGDTVAPTAVLHAPASITVGEDLPLDGAQSFDSLGRIVGYEWTLDSLPTVATTAASFTFTAAAHPLSVGHHVVQLVVVDDSGNRSTADARSVEVTGDSDAPTAVLDAPGSIVEGDDLTVTGDRSFDTGGRIVRYEWTLDALPVVETTAPSFTFRAATNPDALSPGEHTVRLVVVDDSGNRSSADERQVTVLPRVDTVQLHLRIEGLIGLPSSIVVRATARYVTLPAGIDDPLLPSTPPCNNAADCRFDPRAASTVVLDVNPGGNILTGPFVAGWTGCDAQANGRCYVTATESRTVIVRVSRTRPIFSVGTTGGALFSSTAGPGALAFAAARTSTGDLLGGGAVVAVAAAQYGCGPVVSVDRDGSRTTLVTRYGVKLPAQAGAAQVRGYSCRVTVTDATSRSGRDQFTIQVMAPNGVTELAATGDAAYFAFVTLTNIPVVW